MAVPRSNTRCRSASLSNRCEDSKTYGSRCERIMITLASSRQAPSATAGPALKAGSRAFSDGTVYRQPVSPGPESGPPGHLIAQLLSSQNLMATHKPPSRLRSGPSAHIGAFVQNNTWPRSVSWFSTAFPMAFSEWLRSARVFVCPCGRLLSV